MMKQSFHNPIIIIGMHRSGTTMITGMLRNLGLFMGWNLEPNFESRFFLTLNQSLLQGFSGNWDNPYPIENLLTNADLRAFVAENLRRDLQSFRTLYYLGPARYIRNRSLLRLDFPWGWKDPRTTFLLPLWLDIFPRAKVIHIYRNGIDVAASLMKREQRRINDILGKRGMSEFASDQTRQFSEEGVVLYMLNKLRSRYRKLDPFIKYEYMGVSPCISLEQGFELWTRYMGKTLAYMESEGENILQVRYEDFLDDPESNLRAILAFCGIFSDEQTMRSLSAGVNAQRKFAFHKDETLLKFHERVKSHPLMRRLGYAE